MVFISAIKKLGPDAVTFTNDLDFQHRFSKFKCIRKSAKNKRIQQIREILPDMVPGTCMADTHHTGQLDLLNYRLTREAAKKYFFSGPATKRGPKKTQQKSSDGH